MSEITDCNIDMADIERKVSKAKSLLILDHPFFGTAVSKRPLKYDESIATAGMSATGQMYLNPQWVNDLSVRQMMFLLAHEAMHYMFSHALRKGHRDMQAWNVACDKVINDTLIDAKVGEFIDGGITEDGARDKASEELYDENDKDLGNGGTGQDIGEPVGDDGQPLDESEAHAIEAQAKIDAIQSMKVAKSVGKMPSAIERLIDEMVNVETPWHEKLERYMQGKVKDDYSWNRPARRFIGQGVYLPGFDYTPRMGELVIAIDTSGSLSQHELNHFNGHVNRILESCIPEKVTVLYCDYSIGKAEEYLPDDLPIKLKMTGGGGTSFKPVFNWIDDYPFDVDCLIYFTDGWGDQFELEPSKVPTVWLTTGKEEFPFGDVLVYKPEEK